jgi:hypothetical protein
MMGFDYIKIKKLNENLEKNGYSQWAQKLQECINFGSTGTEILMCLNWNIKEFVRAEKDCSHDLLTEVESIKIEISKIVNI